MYFLYDFFINFSITISKIFDWLFLEPLTFTINGISYTFIPIGFLTGGIALSIGIIRRVL